MSSIFIGPPMLTIGADGERDVRYATSSHHVSSLAKREKGLLVKIIKSSDSSAVN